MGSVISWFSNDENIRKDIINTVRYDIDDFVVFGMPLVEEFAISISPENPHITQ